MTNTLFRSISIFVRYLSLFIILGTGSVQANELSKTYAIINTTLGDITVELYTKRAPKTVKNFIHYIESGFYTDTIFHRVIPKFMVQAGGFDKSFTKKVTQAPVVNEANPFVANLRGTIAMARTNNPNSATSQFFINIVDNKSLNKTSTNAGYAVFGKVTKGLYIADKMAKVKTKRQGSMQNIPVTPIIIKSITLSNQSKAGKIGKIGKTGKTGKTGKKEKSPINKTSKSL